jgi:hypothetical protein
MIEARELTKRYGDTTAVHSLSFTIAPGTVTGRSIRLSDAFLPFVHRVGAARWSARTEIRPGQVAWGGRGFDL